MYKKENKSWLKHLDFTLADIAMMQLALIVAYNIRLGWGLPYFYDPYERLTIVMILIDICVVFFVEPYNGILRRGNFQEVNSVIIHCSMLFVGLMTYMVAVKQTEIYSRQLLFSYWLLSMLFVYIGRMVVKIFLRRRMQQADKLSVMILVTTKARAEETMREFDHMSYRDFMVGGIVVVDEDMLGATIHGVPVVANADGFYEYVLSNVVDEVFINGNSVSSSEALANRLLELGITVHFNLIHLNSLGPNKLVEKTGNYMVLTSSMKIASPRQLLVKRIIDICGALVGLVICGIACIFVGPVIKKQSPGPIFFAQERVGKNGRKFKLYKFRSMNVNAEEQLKDLMEKNEMEGFMFKMADDPRIFPMGKFMRKYSIDELPQFWNVLKGDMSLVGTRPPTVKEVEQYELHHRARLGIKPGLTGMWQVSGRSDIKDFEEVVALDTHYISQWSLGLDIKILAKTVQVVLTGRGSE